MNLDLGSTLSRAWQIIWKNKALWLLGILASCGNFNFNFNVPGGGTGGPDRGQGMPPEMQRFFDNIDPAIVVALVCVGLLIFVGLIVLSVIGRGGLIGGVQIAEAGGGVSFGQAWNEGLRHFRTLFLIGLVVGLVTLGVALVTVLPGAVFTAITGGFGAVCLIPLVCMLAILAAVLSIIGYFAQIAAVVEGLSVMPALRRAWDVIRANLGSIVVLGLILLVIGGIAGFVIALPIFLAVLPIMAGVLFGAGSGMGMGLEGGLLVSALCFILYLPILLLLNGILQAWITSAWTLAYRQLTGRAGTASVLPAAPA